MLGHIPPVKFSCSDSFCGIDLKVSQIPFINLCNSLGLEYYCMSTLCSFFVGYGNILKIFQWNLALWIWFRSLKKNIGILYVSKALYINKSGFYTTAQRAKQFQTIFTNIFLWCTSCALSIFNLCPKNQFSAEEARFLVETCRHLYDLEG